MNREAALSAAEALRGHRPTVSFFEDTAGTPRHSVELRLSYADEGLLRLCLRVAGEHGAAADVSCGAEPGRFVVRIYNDYRGRGEEAGG